MVQGGYWFRPRTPDNPDTIRESITQLCAHLDFQVDPAELEQVACHLRDTIIGLGGETDNREALGGILLGTYLSLVQVLARPPSMMVAPDLATCLLAQCVVIQHWLDGTMPLLSLSDMLGLE